MSYSMQPLACEPTRLKGLSERLIVSHYENNYGGAVKRLNAISAQLADLDPTTAPTYLLNGLKREELIAANSMLLHEIYFEGLGESDGPASDLGTALARDFGSVERLAVGIHRDRESPGRRLGLGAPHLFAAQRAARQPVGCGPYPLPGRSEPHSGLGYV
jgi:Fe-Mn family superoxide dismutase